MTEDYVPKSKRGPLAIAAKRCKGLTGQEYKDCVVSVTKELKLSVSEDKIPRERVRELLSKLSKEDLKKLTANLELWLVDIENLEERELQGLGCIDNLIDEILREVRT